MLWKVWRAALCVCFLTAVATNPAASAELSRVEIERTGDHDLVLVHVTEEVVLNVFFLADPHRLVADFKPMSLAKTVQGFDGSGRLVSRIRHGIQPDGSLRLVLDLARAVTVDVQFERGATGGAYRITLRPVIVSMEPLDGEKSNVGIEETAATPIVVRDDDDAQLPGATSSETPSDVDRRSAAEAEAAALITRQLKAMEGADTVRESADAAIAPESPGAAWNAPLAPPWD